MKAILSVFLVLVILIGSFKESAIFVSFKLQQERIANELCIERDLEDSNCGGCCQLKKKLDEQQTEKNVPQPTRKIAVSFDLLFTCNPLKLITSSALSDITYQIYQEQFNRSEFIYDFFRPPQQTNSIIFS